MCEGLQLEVDVDRGAPASRSESISPIFEPKPTSIEVSLDVSGHQARCLNLLDTPEPAICAREKGLAHDARPRPITARIVHFAQVDEQVEVATVDAEVKPLFERSGRLADS
jgi:hypothetical protein